MAEKESYMRFDEGTKNLGNKMKGKKGGGRSKKEVFHFSSIKDIKDTNGSMILGDSLVNQPLRKLEDRSVLGYRNEDSDIPSAPFLSSEGAEEEDSEEREEREIEEKAFSPGSKRFKTIFRKEEEGKEEVEMEEVKGKSSAQLLPGETFKPNSREIQQKTKQKKHIEEEGEEGGEEEEEGEDDDEEEERGRGNASLLVGEDIRSKAEFYRENVRVTHVNWRAFLLHFLLCSFALPLYVLKVAISSFLSSSDFGGGGSNTPRPTLFSLLLSFSLSSLYYSCLLSMVVLYLKYLPPSLSPTEVLLPLALHFFACFVGVFSSDDVIHTTLKGAFQESALRILHSSHVQGKSFSSYSPIEGSHYRQSIKQRISLADLVNKIIEHTQKLSVDTRLNMFGLLVTLLCSAFYASLPQLWRAITGVAVSFEYETHVYVLVVLSFLVNFIISFVSLYVLFQTILHLRARWIIAASFNQITSRTAAQVNELFYFKLGNINNLWGWLSLRGYLLREGKKDQSNPEIILSTSFAFLIPLSISIVFDLIVNRSRGVSIFVVSGLFFCGLLFAYLIICIRFAAEIKKIYQDVDILLAEQLSIQYKLCTIKSSKEKERLNQIHSAIGKVMELIKYGEGKGVLMYILGFEVTERFSQLLIGAAISFASAGVSKLVTGFSY